MWCCAERPPFASLRSALPPSGGCTPFVALRHFPQRGNFPKGEARGFAAVRWYGADASLNFVCVVVDAKNSAAGAWLSLRESWHGAAVTERGAFLRRKCSVAASPLCLTSFGIPLGRGSRPLCRFATFPLTGEFPEGGNKSAERSAEKYAHSFHKANSCAPSGSWQPAGRTDEVRAFRRRNL